VGYQLGYRTTTHPGWKKGGKLKVSVIIPLYNKAAYLERALCSVTSQTWPDIEIIVVDDGSTDGSGAIANAWSDTRLRVIRQCNAGPGAARNRGLVEAAGDLVAFLDADDEWYPDYLQSGVRRLADPRGPATVTFGYVESPSNRSLETYWNSRGIVPGRCRLTPTTPAQIAVAMLAYMSPCTTIARTTVVRRHGGFYDRECCRYAEDATLFLRLLLNEEVAFELEPQARIHRDASGLSNNKNGPRPIEPFLDNPGLVETTCPLHLQPLLTDVLAIRAFKTACILAFWGDWQMASALRRRFAGPASRRLPLTVLSRLLASPAGSQVGRLWRGMFGAIKPPVRY
jgi:GT2 family glycosyltransferase